MLEQVDLSQKMTHEASEKALAEIQLRLVLLEQKLRKHEIPAIIMYEGWDASGKGGSIVRITGPLDPRGFQVWPIGAPNEVERQYNYLWRFWTRLPAKGVIGVFDRSWYGRVLVERVEKFCTPEEWQRAYREIREFERTLIDNGMVLIKFWLHISQDEQLRRFKEREEDPYKQWKIGPDDWRNRKHWDDYLKAAEQMFAETDTPDAPWHLIAAEDKHFTRVETARIVADRLEKAVEAAKERDKAKNGK